MLSIFQPRCENKTSWHVTSESAGALFEFKTLVCEFSSGYQQNCCSKAKVDPKVIAPTMASNNLVWYVCLILKQYYHLAREHDEKFKVVPEGITKCLSAFGTLVYYVSIRDTYHANANPCLHSFAWDVHDSLIQMVGAATAGEVAFFDVDKHVMPPMHRKAFQCQLQYLRCELDALPASMASWIVKQDALKVKHLDRIASAIIMGMADFAEALENIEPCPIPLYISVACRKISEKVQERLAEMTSTMPPTLPMRNAHGRMGRGNVGADDLDAGSGAAGDTKEDILKESEEDDMGPKRYLDYLDYLWFGMSLEKLCCLKFVNHEFGVAS